MTKFIYAKFQKKVSSRLYHPKTVEVQKQCTVDPDEAAKSEPSQLDILSLQIHLFSILKLEVIIVFLLEV